MTIREASELRTGDRIYVRYGSRGRQLAEVVGALQWTSRSGQARLPVRKWRANSSRWTERVYVVPFDVLSVAQ